MTQRPVTLPLAALGAASAVVPGSALALDPAGVGTGFWTPWVVLCIWVALATFAALAMRRGSQGGGERPAVPDAGAPRYPEAFCRLQAAALEAAGDPVSLVDRNGRIVWANPAFVQLTGPDSHDVVGRDLWFAADDPAPLRALLDTTMQTGQTARGESTGHGRNGTIMLHEYTLSPLGGRDGAGHVVVVQRDVSAQRQAALELQRAKDEADAANRAKTDTLAVVSHEVRTPLSGILGLTDLALSTPLTATQREYLDMIQSSAHVMLGVINDILELSRMEAGRLELDAVPLELRDCLETSLAPLRIRAARKGLALTCDVPPDVPDRLVGDAQRLGQILVNLVGNAIKFTDEGRVGVRVTLAGADDVGRRALRAEGPGLDAEDTAPVVLHLAVSDTGIGIPAEQQERIFDAFEQGDASRTRCAGGTGLGLAIAMRLTRKMGGWMWVESEVGRGSTFHLTLRFGMQAEQAAVCGLQPCLDGHGPARRPAGDGPSAPVAPANRLHVLLAEDDPIHERLVVAILQQRGHTVTVAHTGIEALRLIDTAPVDVVLMDVRMPEMDGLEATAELRRRETQRLTLDTPTSALRHAHIPVIAMTAAAMPHDRERCLAAGMDDYLTKPFGPAALFAKIEAAGRRDHPATAAAVDVPHPPSTAVVDRDLLFEQLDDNVTLLRELLRLFNERGPRLLAGIRTAIAAGDAQQLQLLAHGLKGSLGNLAAPVGQTAAGEIEACAARGDLRGAAAVLPTLEAEVARVPSALVAILEERRPAVAA